MIRQLLYKNTTNIEDINSFKKRNWKEGIDVEWIKKDEIIR